MKTATLCFLLKDDKICLGEKKRGFGKGKPNGFGGKVGDKEEFKNETPEMCVIREAKEEFGNNLLIKKEDLEKVAEFTFQFPHDPSSNQLVHVYFCRRWTGEPQESEEMKPVWHLRNEIPYDQMWDDDKVWLPQVLNGEQFKGTFVFDNQNKIAYQKLQSEKNTN